MSVTQALVEAFVLGHAADAALALESVEDQEAAAALWASLSSDAQAALLANLPHATAARLLANRDAGQVAAAIGRVPGDLAAPVLRAMAPERRDIVLLELGEKGQALARLLGYPEGSAGALMDPLVPAYNRELTVSDALARARRDAAHAISYVYVVDAGGQLQGVLTVRELLLAAPAAPLHAVMRPTPAALPASASLETVLSHPGWQRAHALPVVDRGRYVGALRHRTLRALEHEPLLATGRRDRVRTSRDLAEVYALGWSSLFSWGAVYVESALRGGKDDE